MGRLYSMRGFYLPETTTTVELELKTTAEPETMTKEPETDLPYAKVDNGVSFLTKKEAIPSETATTAEPETMTTKGSETDLPYATV